MAATETLTQIPQSHNSLKPRHGVVTLFGYGVDVRVDRGHLLLQDGIAVNRQRIRLPRVAHGLRRLIVIGSDGSISLAALRWLSDQKASFVLLERDGRVHTVTGPASPSDARLRRVQGLAHQSDAALSIARELIHQKLTGQEQVARYKLLDSTTADEIANFRAELPSADCINSIRVIEAQAAATYWSAWRTLPVSFPKNDVPRVPDHWRTFGTRISPLTGSPRLAANPANGILNYLYALLEAETRLAIVALGLDPGLGVLHADAPTRDSLVFDLLEPVRPQVDAYLLDWITQQPLKREWFFEQRNGNCRLMGPFATQLSETAQTWGRAVAPVAEWFAQTLWKNIGTPSRNRRLFATRLTHRRSVEGRGGELRAQAKPTPRREKVCAVCGAEGVRNRYCHSCAVEVARDHMALVATIGHMKPKTQRVKAHISKRLSGHAVANTWWSSSSLPTWLNEVTYTRDIQPRLRDIKVRKIAEALQISAPYAAFIRAGKRRPHPRHWLALAELVGIPEVHNHAGL